MSVFKDTYDIIKDLLQAAKAVQNQDVVQLAMDLQEKFFELREDNENLLSQIKSLETKLTNLEKANLLEEEIEYSPKGFFTLKQEKPKIPYCSCCWKLEHKLVPLSYSGGYYGYTCGNCKTNLYVMTEDRKNING